MGGDLSKGALEVNIVTCPKHRAKLDVTTVKVVSGLKVSLMHPKTQEKPTAPQKSKEMILMENNL
jgi:nitrite reductase/ring-hydroxylating ferredoxin subunit